MHAHFFVAKKSLAAISLMLLLSMLLVACGGSSNTTTATNNNGITVPTDLVSSGVLTVGSDTTYPPQEFSGNTPGTYQGFDIDLINAIGQKIGLKVNVVKADFNTIIDSLSNKRFDVVISAMTISPEREQKVAFVPYFNAGESLLVQKGNPLHLTKPSDLCGKNIGVQKGTVEETDLDAASTACTKAGKPAINLTSLDDQTAVVQLLVNQRVVATYQDSPVTDYFNLLNHNEFSVGGSVLNAAQEGIAVRKGDTAMYNAIKAGFDAVKQDGTYTNLIKKWNLQNEAI
jgi:polar amino acid transport system substrate-binding protein